MDGYTAMVLSGGGIKGFAILGAIQYLMDRQPIHGLRRIIGTSVGAIIGYLYCIGYTPTEIMIFFCSNPNLLNNLIRHANAANVLNGSGVMAYSGINDILEAMTVAKTSRFMNLQELYDYSGIELVCCTFNASKGQTECISKDTHPSMGCLTALRMSANLPYVFDWFHYEGSEYMDGGISDNFPFRFVRDGERAVGIWIAADRTPPHPSNFLSRFFRLLHFPIDELTAYKNRDAIRHGDAIPITVEESNPFRFHLSVSERFDMFSEGYQQCAQYFDAIAANQKDPIETKASP